MTNEGLWALGSAVSIIWIVVNAILFSDRDYSRKREIMNELGVSGLFYFTIPFFSMFYHFVIEHQRKNNGTITKLFQRREINKLLIQIVLPIPLAPAINMCGIFAKSTTTGRPATSRPKLKASLLL